MADISQVKAHMEVIGADGVHVGTVDKVEGDRIKLTKQDSGSHKDHHHYLSAGLIATVEGNKVRLSANGQSAVLLEEEKSGGAIMDERQNQEKGKTSQKNSDQSLWNWNKIGLGALGVAAVGAVASAAMLRGRSEKDDDFELRLETDETVRLISSSKVEGTPVIGKDGATLGKIDSFMVDKYTGRVAYAVMSFGGTMGVGASYFPLPWPLLDYDIDKDGYVLDITKEQLAGAPRFEASKAPEFSPDYRRRILVFYRR